jgi:hypothetical protein
MTDSSFIIMVLEGQVSRHLGEFRNLTLMEMSTNETTAGVWRAMLWIFFLPGHVFDETGR